MSVVMPVHNALPYLDAAVESILNQTFADFEFVMLDDASTDGSRQRLREWAAKDERIRLLEADTNLGPVQSSNRVARAAQAPIVARMDADDISYPRRLEEQLQALRDHPEAGLVGSLADVIDSQGRQRREPEYWRLTQRSRFIPFPHGTLTYRKQLFDRVGGYRDECVFWEDQDLISRMAQEAAVIVIPHPLYKYRQSASSTRFTSQQQRLERSLDLFFRSQDCHRNGADCEDVLRNPPPPEAKIDPRVFISLGSVILWAGQRPRLFRRLLRRAKLSLDFRTAAAIVWTAWASLSPSTLRPFLLLLLRVRNWRVKGEISKADVRHWSPS